MKNLFLKLKNENGQSIVELAIVLPILMTLVCGIIDFGWLYSCKLAVINSGREGARYAVVNSTNADVVNLTKAKVSSISPDSIKDSLNVGITFSNPGNPRMGDVTITVDSTVAVLTPLAGIFFADQQMDLSSSVTMKVG